MLTFTFDLFLDSDVPGLEEDHIGPATLQISKGSDVLRRKATLTNGKWTTVDYGEGTPWLWFVIVTGSKDVEIGFGQGTPMTVENGGPPQIWTGSDIPSFKPVGGDSEIIVFIVFE
jgi:hypothetical protein